MEPESALCWKSEQARRSLRLHGADKVTLAIKSLNFHQNIKVKAVQTRRGACGKLSNVGFRIFCSLTGSPGLARIHTLLHLASFN